MPTDAKEEIDLKNRGSIKSVISEMSNMGLKSESTGNNDKKAENMWNDCSDNTRAFPKLNNIQKIYIEGASGTQFEISLTVFSTWMLSE